MDMSAAAAAALADTGLVEVRPAADGQWQLLPRGYVGAVRVDGLQVQVTPKEKVGLVRLLFLLGYARDPGFRPEDVTGAEEPDLWPALAESLARLTESALAGGVLQDYQTVDEALSEVLGLRAKPEVIRPIRLTMFPTRKKWSNPSGADPLEVLDPVSKGMIGHAARVTRKVVLPGRGGGVSLCLIVSVAAARPEHAHCLFAGWRSGVSSGKVGASAPPSISMTLPVT
jgi:hypothetical protein